VGGKKNKLLSIDAIGAGSGPALFVFLAVAILSLPAADARGISAAPLDRPRERALGLDQTGSVILGGAPAGGTGTTWRVEAGEWFLYGIDGLRTHAAAAEIGGPSWELRVSAAFVAAPVGSESAVEGGLCAPLGRVRLGASLRWDTARLDGCEKAHLVTLSVSAMLRVSERIAISTRAANIRLAGEPLPGAGASVGVLLSPESALCALARLELSPAGATSFRVASRVRLGRRVLLSLGYEEGTGSFDGSVWIRIGCVGLDAGSSIHPVLGVSQGVFLSWGRGW